MNTAIPASGRMVEFAYNVLRGLMHLIDSAEVTFLGKDINSGITVQKGAFTRKRTEILALEEKTGADEVVVLDNVPEFDEVELTFLGDGSGFEPPYRDNPKILISCNDDTFTVRVGQVEIYVGPIEDNSKILMERTVSEWIRIKAAIQARS